MENLKFEENKKPDVLDISKVIYLLSSKWYYIVGAMIIALGVALYINRYSKSLFEAHASLIYQTDNDAFTNYMSSFRYARRNYSLDVQNEITKMQSYTVTRRTIDRLDFDIHYVGIGRWTENELYQANTIDVIPTGENTKGLPFTITVINDFKYKLEVEKPKIEETLNFNQEYKSDLFNFKVLLKSNSENLKKFKIKFQDANNLTTQYQNKLKITVDKENSAKINLSMRGYVKTKLVTYLNTFCDEFLSYSLEQKIEQSDNSLSYIEGQIKVIEDSIANIEKRMISYKKKQDIFDKELESEIAFSNFRTSYRELAMMDFKQRYYEYMKEYFVSETEPRELIKPSWVGIDDPMLTGLIEDISVTYREKIDKNVMLKKELPGFNNSNKKINEIRLMALDKIEGVLESNQKNISWLEQDLNSAKLQLRNLPMSETEYLKIERTYNLYNNYFNFLLEKRAEGGIQKASMMPETRLLDASRLDNVTELGPNKLKTIAYALLIGMIIPIGLIFVFNYFNFRIESKDDIIKNTDVPILGLLGHNETDSSIPVFENPRSKLTESFRRIRTDLRFYLHNENENTILVTSAISGEGKTFITVNMAIISAMSHRKVLLIGLDLRKPTMHKTFNISNRKGLSSYLIGKHSMDEIIFETNINNLHVVPSGPIPPNPVELMESERMKIFFETVKPKYDLIFVDTPPLAVVTDAQILSEYVSLCVFVLRQKYSHKDVFEFINNLQRNNKFKKLALIVNDLEPSRALGYNYSYGYSYAYGYGYGYKSKDNYYYYKNKGEEEEDGDLYN